MSNEDLQRARDRWQMRGQQRPAGAEEPGPRQESVWDYPRPPTIVDDARLVQIRFKGQLIAETRAARRVLETASPPAFYLPPDSIKPDCLQPSAMKTFCEWKGQATYFDVCVDGECSEQAAWTYADPFPEFEAIRGYLAFYPDGLQCTVDGETVQAQAGGFYGGWITAEIVGPFKGEPGTGGW